MKIKTYLKRYFFFSTLLILLSMSMAAFSFEKTADEQVDEKVTNEQENNKQTVVEPVTENTTTSTTTPEPKSKTSDWINNSVNNLDKNGVLKIPDWVDYDSLVSQKDFAIMLSKA